MSAAFPVALRRRECLIVAADAKRIAAIASAARHLGLPDTFAEISSAERLLAQDRFSIVVLDSEATGSQDFLRVLRRYCARTSAVSVLLLPESGTLRRGLSEGATLVIRRPRNTDAARKSLRSALNLTRPDLRRALRLSLEPVVHIAAAGHSLRGQVLDISERGIGVAVREPLPLGTTVQLRLLLPGMKVPLETAGGVVHVESDRMGIRFAQFSSREHQLRLLDWLSYLREYAREDGEGPEPVPTGEGNRRPSAPSRSGWKRMWTSVVRP